MLPNLATAPQNIATRALHQRQVLARESRQAQSAFQRLGRQVGPRAGASVAPRYRRRRPRRCGEAEAQRPESSFERQPSCCRSSCSCSRASSCRSAAMLGARCRRHARSRGLCRASRRSCALGRRGLARRCGLRRARRRHSRRARRRHARQRGHAAQLRRRRDSGRCSSRPAGALPATLAGSRARRRSIAIDPKWDERETWAAIRRAGGPVTDFYLLAALDLRRDADRRDRRRRRRNRRCSATCSAARCGSPASSRSPACCSATRSRTSSRGSSPAQAGLLLFLVLLPFWTSLLVRTVAWVRPAAARGHPEQPLPVARAHRRAGADDLQPLRRLRRDGARAAAVHGAAAATR